MVPVGEVVERYRRAGGGAVDPEELAFWRICVLVENAALWLRTTRAWEDPALRRETDLLASVRRVCRSELEAELALGG